ncbi:hypothetical protein [Paenibacillus terrae]|uniref:Uncharacterized protein n=1 Tax=Paenibacillus terrae TaxID=159743 RepID=A0A0D7X475_9BACL|nr:hypothetical protein [Paenibacillus terrae]KJD44822.1 hypothetical protein QD47_15190 [Paenibacillus terrae]
MAFIQRYETNQTGAVTFIGNTLGLARSASVGVPGNVTSIGAFITTNTASRFDTYPLGTTSAITSNSSTAFLVLPAGSTVLYAELIWGGSYANGSTNVLSSASNPVTFHPPALSTTVSPESATSVNDSPALIKPGEPLFIGSLQPGQKVNASYTVNVRYCLPEAV